MSGRFFYLAFERSRGSLAEEGEEGSVNVIIIDRVIEKGKGREMICVGCFSPRLNYRTVEDYRYVTRGREKDLYAAYTYMHVCMCDLASF